MKMSSQKIYALVSGIILFLVGIIGFAFGSLNIPDGYLLLSLVLGFWGIVVACMH